MIIYLFCLEKLTRTLHFAQIIEFIQEEKFKTNIPRFLILFKDTLEIYNKNKSHLDSFKLYIDKKKRVLFICLDSSIGFQNILSFNPKCVILASGTLSPFDIVEKQLNHNFDYKLSIDPDLN